MKDTQERVFDSEVVLSVIIVGIALSFGLYARFKGLSIWPLASDEYHTVKSISFILESGFPEFPCGGYYTRGLMYQYLLAGIGSFSSLDPTGVYRGVTAFSGLLGLPALAVVKIESPGACRY